jgi:hypothetical protein
MSRLLLRLIFFCRHHCCWLFQTSFHRVLDLRFRKFVIEGFLFTKKQKVSPSEEIAELPFTYLDITEFTVVILNDLWR